jgi:outer membrane protein assembly factor BamB
VLADDEVYFSTLDGTLYCCSQNDGSLIWSEHCNATSSPVVVEKKCYFSQREEVVPNEGEPGVQQTEHCARRASASRAKTRRYRSTSRKADYLDFTKRQARSARHAAYAAYDAHVGFAASKGSAKIAQAMRNLGHGHVSGLWAFQGSKPFFSKGRLFASMGDAVYCVDADSEQLVWKRHLAGAADDEPVDSVVTPPALVNGKVFVCTATGGVFALSADSGEIVWRADVGEPVLYQPAIARGRVYVPTQLGALYCLETCDLDDDGWLMWGATPSHNGLASARDFSLA